MRGYSTRDKVIYWLFADKIPLTKILIVSNIATFLAIRLFKLGIIAGLLGFSTRTVTLAPWTLLTYPFIGLLDPIGLIFAALWLWWAAGSLERSWGTARFAVYFFIMSAISGLGLYLGAFLLGITDVGANPWLPIAGITIAFAMLNPEQQIMFYFIIPLKLKYLALIDVVFILITYGQIHLLLGIFALAGCAFSYWYVRPGRWSVPARQQRNETNVVHVYQKPSILQRLNPWRRAKERRDRDRLRKLFEQSGMGDDEPRDR